MNKKILVLGFVIFAILSALAMMKFMGFGQSRAITEKERFERVLRQDRKVLKDKYSLDSDVHSALVRLGEVMDPLARAESLGRAKNESSLVRAGVANALGFFDDESSLTAIKILLSDRETSVRIQAITGLGHRSNRVREALVFEVLKRETLTEEERETALSMLIQIAHSNESRQKAIQELVSSARKQSSPRVRARTAARALAAAPRDPRVLEMLEEILRSGKTPDLESTGIRHLAAVGNPWLKANIVKLSMSENVQTRLAVVQSLHAVCPPGRFDILQWLFEKEIDINVRSAAFDELEHLLGPTSINFLENVIQNNKIRAEVLARLKSVLAEHKLILRTGSGTNHDLCRSVSKDIPIGSVVR